MSAHGEVERHDASWRTEARSCPRPGGNRDRESASGRPGHRPRHDGERREGAHRTRGAPRSGTGRPTASEVGSLPKRGRSPHAREPPPTDVAEQSSLCRHRAEKGDGGRERRDKERCSSAQRRTRRLRGNLVDLHAGIASGGLGKTRRTGTRPTLVCLEGRARPLHRLPKPQAVSCESEHAEQQPDRCAADEKESQNDCLLGTPKS
jgi:hypothetical protein